MERADSVKGPWCWERLKVGGEGDDRGWDGWIASPTQWTCVWVSSRSWWWTGKPGVLQSVGLQSRTQLRDWTELMHLKFNMSKAKFLISPLTLLLPQSSCQLIATAAFQLLKWETMEPSLVPLFLSHHVYNVSGNLIGSTSKYIQNLAYSHFLHAITLT